MYRMLTSKPPIGSIWTRTQVTHIVLVEEHGELLYRDAQIGLVELVGYVPAKWAKLPPLLQQGVEETQPIEHLLEGFLEWRMWIVDFVTGIRVLWSKYHIR